MKIIINEFSDTNKTTLRSGSVKLVLPNGDTYRIIDHKDGIQVNVERGKKQGPLRVTPEFGNQISLS
jgi:hypothetical protein